MHRFLLFSAIVVGSFCSIFGQNIYVNPVEGIDTNIGTQDFPFQTITAAIHHTNLLTGSGNITVKLLPGLYTLNDKVVINPIRQLSDTTRLTIEAFHNPTDKDWNPTMMPVIQSTSLNNSATQFPHATGFLVAASHVTITGLKFLGNANPETKYYYPISKENENLKDLVVSQSIFIGNKEAAPIQGGVWAHGPDNVIENCIFFQCRNGVLFFNNVDNFSIKNTIVTESYESAFWFGPENYTFNFSNNLIFNNNHVLVGVENKSYSSAFNNSIITQNDGYTGYWSRQNQEIKKNEKPSIKENKITRKGKLKIQKNMELILPKNHLHLISNIRGHKLKAGIFK